MKELSKGTVFGSWKTPTVSEYIRRRAVANKFEPFTIHQVRVLVVVSLCALDWPDSHIKTFINWKSNASLENYRTGLDLATIGGLPELNTVYGDSNRALRIQSELERIHARAKQKQ